MPVRFESNEQWFHQNSKFKNNNQQGKSEHTLVCGAYCKVSIFHGVGVFAWHIFTWYFSHAYFELLYWLILIAIMCKKFEPTTVCNSVSHDFLCPASIPGILTQRPLDPKLYVVCEAWFLTWAQSGTGAWISSCVGEKEIWLLECYHLDWPVTCFYWFYTNSWTFVLWSGPMHEGQTPQDILLCAYGQCH